MGLLTAVSLLVLLVSQIGVAVEIAPLYSEGVWPGFRGPNGSGHAQAQDLPVEWNEKKNVRWKTAIHDLGWSSPVVWGQQVWLTTATANGKSLYAICVDRSTGQIVHDRKLFDVANPAFRHAANSYASCTPAIEEGRVYLHFGSEGTACLETLTGQVIWSRRDLPCDHFRGPGSSPLLWGKYLFLCFDGFDQQYTVALDKTTGKTLWRADRDLDFGTDDGDFKKAYGTPSIVMVNGQSLLISPGAAATMAYEPETGKEIWRVRHGGFNVAAPPQAALGLVFLCTGDGGDKLLAIRPDGQGELREAHRVWQTNKGVPARSAPLIVGDLLFMTSDKAVLSCLDARTGQMIWQQRMEGNTWASPILADGKLYFCNQEGATFVIAPTRQFQKLATNHLNDGCNATPAAAGKSLFLRTKTHLYCLEKP